MTRARFPVHGWIGLILIAVFWWINWEWDGLRSHWAFFPLWLGYVFAFDGLAVLAGRPSLARKTRSFVLLFVLSAPIWWLFEAINKWVQYWEYQPYGMFIPPENYLWSTLAFSTVIPAVFVTANLLCAVPWFRRHHVQLRAGKTAAGRMWFFIAGSVMLACTAVWPSYGMAFLWVSLFFILDPVNGYLGNRSILRMTARGDWRALIILFAATLICGFFWEMWNLHSWPKWIYTLPYLDGLKIFEMPLAGYFGYLPFGLELFAFVVLFERKLHLDLPEFP